MCLRDAGVFKSLVDLSTGRGGPDCRPCPGEAGRCWRTVRFGSGSPQGPSCAGICSLGKSLGSESEHLGLNHIAPLSLNSLSYELGYRSLPCLSQGCCEDSMKNPSKCLWCYGKALGQPTRTLLPLPPHPAFGQEAKGQISRWGMSSSFCFTPWGGLGSMAPVAVDPPNTYASSTSPVKKRAPLRGRSLSSDREVTYLIGDKARS